jgi:hypothetical protein
VTNHAFLLPPPKRFSNRPRLAPTKNERRETRAWISGS